MSSQLDDLIERAYGAMDGNQMAESYSARHGIESAAILTVTDDERAGDVAAYVRERIEGKIVVEIGGGIGLLGCHLAQFARRVFVIEAQPIWSAAFVWALYARKPANLTYILGAADEMADTLRADVALFCTLSGHASMRRAALRFAPEVIDVYDEIISGSAPMSEQKRAILEELARCAPPLP